MRKRTIQAGQAIVETALMAMLLFFMLSAALDVGLMYFAVQAASNAALDGASYGSILWPTTPSSGGVPANYGAIVARVRNEPGDIRNTIVSMRDLNSDGTEYNDNDFISVTYQGNTFGGTDADCDPPTIGNCEVVVQVEFIYRPYFVLAPTFGAGEVRLSATRTMPVLDYTTYDPDN